MQVNQYTIDSEQKRRRNSTGHYPPAEQHQQENRMGNPVSYQIILTPAARTGGDRCQIRPGRVDIIA